MFDATEMSILSRDKINSRPDAFVFIYMVIAVPVFEELFFRGFILGGLLKRYSPIISIGISSLLFATIHISLIGPFLFAIFSGWIYYRTRNLLYSIIMHAVLNFLAFSMRYSIFKEFATIDSYNRFMDTNIFFICLVLIITLAICLYVLFKLLNNYRLTKSIEN